MGRGGGRATRSWYVSSVWLIHQLMAKPAAAMMLSGARPTSAFSITSLPGSVGTILMVALHMGPWQSGQPLAASSSASESVSPGRRERDERGVRCSNQTVQKRSAPARSNAVKRAERAAAQRGRPYGAVRAGAPQRENRLSNGPTAQRAARTEYVAARRDVGAALQRLPALVAAAHISECQGYVAQHGCCRKRAQRVRGSCWSRRCVRTSTREGVRR